MYSYKCSGRETGVPKKGIALVICLLEATFPIAYHKAFGEEQPDFALEMRIATDSDAGVALLPTAYSANCGNAYSKRALTANWIALSKKKTSDLGRKGGPIVRTSDKGNISVLVLIGSNDLTERNDKELQPSRDMYGRPSLLVIPDRQGRLLLGKLIGENLNRPLAQIIDGHICTLPTVKTKFVHHAAIESTFTMDGITNMANRFKRGVDHHDVCTSSLHLSIWYLSGGIVAFLVVVLAILPSPGFQVSRIWPVMGMCVGAVVGAYYLGFEKYYGSATWDGEFSCVEIGYRILLFRMIMGILLGGALGFLSGYLVRRAVHNIRSLASRKLKR